jgi:hypothetical protein
MRSIFLALALLSAPAMLALAGPPAAEDAAIRWVEVCYGPATTQTQVLHQLQMLGFTVDSEPGRERAGVLRGRLPESALDEAARLTGVTRLIVGPVLPKEPPRPPVERYRVRLRFRIDASPQQRLQLYREMLKTLEAFGFQKDKGLENEELYSDLLSGTVPAASADQLLREPYVRTVLLLPEGFKLPEEPDAPVLVRLGLNTRFGPLRQAEVDEQTRALLQPLGFQESAGYEGQGQGAMLGWLPAGRLETVLREVKPIELTLPRAHALAGNDSPATIRLEPIRRIEVVRTPAGLLPPQEPAGPAPIPAEEAALAKISPDLRTYLDTLKDEAQTKPLRVEVILRSAPAPDADDGARVIGQLMAVEGRLGPLVSGWVYPAQVRLLALSPEVSTVRLPQPARPFVLPPDPKAPLPLEFVPLGRPQAEPAALDALVRRRRPQRLAVVAGEFRGYDRFVGIRLPKTTSLIDLTVERNPDLRATPVLGDPDEIGAGTRLALALVAAAPADELYLVRIDPEAPAQLQQVARSVAGGPWDSEAVRRHERTLRQERQRLDEEQLELRILGRVLRQSFREDDPLRKDPARMNDEERKAREEYRRRVARFEEAERDYARKLDAYLDLHAGAQQLRKVDTVLVSLHWADGHVNLPGTAPGLRNLELDPERGAAWIQARPRRPGQAWSGLFRDADGDGVMEFVPAGRPAADRPELNFLAWQPHPWLARPGTPAAGDKVSWQELPANAVVQITLQWREVHDPAWKDDRREDVYRQPLAPLQIEVLRQLDPAGHTLPPDLFEVVGRTTNPAARTDNQLPGDLPERLENQPRSAIYQQTLRFQVGERPARYAVRVKGRQPESTLPPRALTLPHREGWELRPRLTVEVVDPTRRAAGRVVFQSHAGDEEPSVVRKPPAR